MMMGAPGRRFMDFKVIGKPGCKETVRFYYTQPWTFKGFDSLDEKTIADQVISVDIIV